MDAQNSSVYDFLVESINNFINSSQHLNQNHLTEIVSLINGTYNSKIESVRIQREKDLEEFKQSIGWKKYVLDLFHIAYFSENINPFQLQQVLFENSSTIFKQGIYVLNTDEFLVLLAANICCLVNSNISARDKKTYLIRSMENLLRIEVPGKGTYYFSYLIFIYCIEQIESAMELYIKSYLDKATPLQAFGLALILRQLKFENSLNDLDTKEIEYYLTNISQLSLATLASADASPNSNSETFSYILEIINCFSEQCYYLVERWTKFPNSEVDDQIIIQENAFQENLIFQSTSLLSQIIDLIEKILAINISNSEVKLLSLSENKELNTILDKTKKNAIEILGLLISHIFKHKELHHHKYSEQETATVNNFIQRFEEYLKFFLTQLHQTIIGLYSSNLPLNYKVIEIFKL